MKVVYDPEVDVLTVLLNDAPVAESDQDKPGVILDCNGPRYLPRPGSHSARGQATLFSPY